MEATKNKFLCHESFSSKDGVTLRDYVETLVKELKEQQDDKIISVEEKLATAMTANDKLYSQRFDSSDQAVHEAFASAQQAISKSEGAQEKRNDAVYVSIGSLQQALAQVISRGEFALSTKNTDDRYDILKKLISDLQLQGTNFISITSYNQRHEELQRQVNELRDAQAGTTGKGVGVGQGWGISIAAFGMIIGILGVMFKVFG
jgi:hypothetical protein